LPNKLLNIWLRKLQTSLTQFSEANKKQIFSVIIMLQCWLPGIWTGLSARWHGRNDE
jgi:hypothetical protein